MPYAPPVHPQLLKQFKESAKGLSPAAPASRLSSRFWPHFHTGITVLTAFGDGELFRLGAGAPSHGIHGVHIHPIAVQWGTWQLKTLELGRFRVGFKES